MMRNIILFLTFFVSISINFSFATTKDISSNPSITSLESVRSEVSLLQEKLEKIKSRESEIYEFKIRFSELVTNFSSTGVYNNQFQNDRKALEQLEKSVLDWRKENQQIVDKTKELGMVLDQIYSSYQGMKKQGGSKKDRAQYTSAIRETDKVIEELKSYQSEFLKHDKFLEKFTEDTKRWKNFLVSRIKSSLDSGLLRWNLNAFVTSPLSTMGELWSVTGEVIRSELQFSFSQFLSAEIAPLLGRLVFAGFIFFLIMRVISILRQWTIAYRGGTNYRSFIRMVEIICRHPKSLASLSFLVLFFGEWGVLSYEQFPRFTYLILGICIFTLAWVRVLSPVLMVFVGVLNQMSPRKGLVIRTGLIYLLIVLKIIGHYLSLDNDFITLLAGGLLGWISFKLFYLALSLQLDSERGAHEKWRVFFKAIKIFFIIFTAAVFVASILQLIGFYNLGMAIQSVVAHNLSVLAFGWAFYQVYGIVLDDLLRRFNGQKKIYYICELISFLRKNGSILFSTLIGILLLESWYKAVFVFGDFWKSSIFTVGDYQLSVDRVFKIFVCYYLFRIVHLITLAVIDRMVQKQGELARSNSSNYFVIVRYLFILVFFFVFAAILGFTYKNLLIFASALGVGIGFGLQNIVNNFISGIILLFERPIRVGDIIDVDGIFCQVKQIGIRSTIVETPDNSSVILPNSDILSNKVVNWTLNGNTIAIRCEVGVAYGSDTHFVRDILQGVVSGHPEILDFPVPQVWFTEFADSSLNFMVKAWINKPDDRATIKSDLYHRINARFSECGIEIPFPQRDIHIKSDPKN